MKLRVIVWIIVIAVTAVIMFQNQVFYLSAQPLSLDLAFVKFETPPVANAIHVLSFFLIGVVLTCLSLYSERFKLRRQVKSANSAFHSCAEQVTELRASETTAPKRKFFRLPGRRSKAVEQVNEVATTDPGNQDGKVLIEE